MKQPFILLVLALSLNNSFSQNTYLDSILSGQRSLTTPKDHNVWMNYLDSSTIDVAAKQKLIIKRLALDIAELNKYTVWPEESASTIDRIYKSDVDKYNDSIKRAQYPIINLGNLAFAIPLYIIDGVPDSYPYPYYKLLCTLSEMNIDKIDVIKDWNGAISLFGHRAVGGVILIITKKQSKKHKHK